MLLTFLAVVVAMALWAALGGLGATMTWRGLYGWPDPTQPECRRCRYVLVGLRSVDGRCPECGSDVSLVESVRSGRSGRSSGRAIAGAVLVLLVLAPLVTLVPMPSAIPAAPVPVAVLARPAPRVIAQTVADDVVRFTETPRWAAIQLLDPPAAGRGAADVLTDVEKRWARQADDLILNYIEIPQRWTENAATGGASKSRRSR